MENKIIEICSYSVQSVLNAYNSGADRVELCANMYEGGTTPSLASVIAARQIAPIKLHVIVRPRGGDFCYSALEFEIMKKDIELIKEIGADGIVIGLLNEDGTVDVQKTKELVKIASPMSVTFHRAFDMTVDPFEALKAVIDTGAERILTSGQEASAYDGRNLISELIDKADSSIIIMPGGGINCANIIRLMKETGASEVHLSAKKYIPGKMTFRKNNMAINSQNTIPEYDVLESDTETIKTIVDLVKNSV